MLNSFVVFFKFCTKKQTKQYVNTNNLKIAWYDAVKTKSAVFEKY